MAALREGFRSPPPEARLRCYWWWLNGNTTEETITRDLTEMSRKGFGGVLLVDANGANQNGNADVAPGPTFGSPAWTKLYVHALKTAASLHLEVTLNITSGWNLGGPNVTPAEASKLLTWSRTAVDESGFTGELPTPPIKNGFYGQIAVLAYPLTHGPALPGQAGSQRAPLSDLRLKSASAELSFSMPKTEFLLDDSPSVAGERDTDLNAVVDLSSRVDASGYLAWRPPSPGMWEVLRIGYTDSGARVSTSSGSWQGWAIDYLDRGAFDAYWDRTVDPLLQDARPYWKTTLVSLATDSWEMGGANWTGRFAAEFRARRGYDPVRYLPIVAGRILEDRGTSDRFLNDLRRTVGDLVTDHYDHFAERAKAYGLGIQCESGGPHGAPLDALETFRSAAVPQTEYWAQSNEHRSRDEDRFFTKEAASAANIYGKRLVAQEGMTSIGPQWSESLATDLKPSFDQALTEGMNRLVWHEFTSSPASFGLPGNEYFAGTHLNPNVTWWDQGGAFFTYLNRSQWMLRQGHTVSDVLYFYGDEVPNFVRLKSDDPARVLPGYDYDVTNEDALLHSLRVQGRSIATPAGNRYRLLVLPRSRRMSLASLEHIARYVRAGGAIVGEPPLAPTGLLDSVSTHRFADLSREMWADCKAEPHPYGSGTVDCTNDARRSLARLGAVPDFEEKSGHVDYIHRAAKGLDIYFVRNRTALEFDGDVEFRVAGRVPDLWDALDGSMVRAATFATERNSTGLRLKLAPFGSVFVVFSNASPVETTRTVAKLPVVRVEDLPAGQWTVTFQQDRGAPTGAQPLKAFASWSEAADPGIRYFSGTATYRTQFTHRGLAAEKIFLTLTDVREICTVVLNGKELGTLWAKPYRLDMTDGLVDGRNDLELRVTNLWPNRIIGDAQPGVTKTYTRTNIRKYTASSPLLPSGLIGPVVLEKARGVERFSENVPQAAPSRQRP